MPISYNQIPATLRRGWHIEFDSSLAGSLSQELKLLVPGQRLSTGTVAEGVPKRIFDPSQAENYWGRGSMLGEMFRAIRAADQFVETWGIALDEDGAGVAATGDITFTGPATKAGTVVTYIAGHRIKTAVAESDTATDIAAAVVADINANTRLPVTAAVNGVDDFIVDLTCRWKGETGNDIDVRFNYHEGESFPAGVGAEITAMNGGTTNPDIATAIAGIGAEQYNWIVMPFTDAANLSALESELDDRWNAMSQNDGRAFAAYRDNLANTTTFGDGRNSEHVCTMGTNMAPEPTYIWASVVAVTAAASLTRDPSRQMHTLELKGLKPPARDVRWTSTESHGLLFDGISTYYVDANDRVRIGDLITMYQENAQGVDDDSFLYLNTPETLSRYRKKQIALLLSKFPNAKLTRDEDGDFAGDNAVMQPKKARNELFALYREHVEELVWFTDVEDYEATFVSKIDADNKNRLNVQDQPTLVGNYRAHAQKTQFRT